MKKVFVTLAVTAAMATGGAVVTTATAAAADGWCDGVTKVAVGRTGDYVRQPYNKATGSRNCLLAKGSSGAAVSELQRALKKCNFASALVVDGDFGPKTETAVKKVQATYGIAADGVYGPDTRRVFRWQAYRSNGTSTGACVRVD